MTTCPHCQKPVSEGVPYAGWTVHPECQGRIPLAPNAENLHCRKCGDDGRWSPHFVLGWNVLCPACFEDEAKKGRIRVHDMNKIATGVEYLK